MRSLVHAKLAFPLFERQLRDQNSLASLVNLRAGTHGGDARIGPARSIVSHLLVNHTGRSSNSTQF